MLIDYDWSEFDSTTDEQQKQQSDLRNQCEQAKSRANKLAAELDAAIATGEKADKPIPKSVRRAFDEVQKNWRKQLRKQRRRCIGLKLNLCVAYLRYCIIWSLRQIWSVVLWTFFIFFQLAAAVFRIPIAIFRKLKQLLIPRSRR